MDTSEEEAAGEPLAKWAEDVGAIFNLVVTVHSNAFQEAGFLPVSEAAAVSIKMNTGLDVFGYEHIVDTSSIRHILKHHGTSAERKRGQEPIGKEDFIQLAFLLLNPDIIEYAGKNKQGRDVLRFTKSIAECTVTYTEEVRTKKGRLAAVTLYKRRNKEE